MFSKEGLKSPENLNVSGRICEFFKNPQTANLITNFLVNAINSSLLFVVIKEITGIIRSSLVNLLESCEYYQTIFTFYAKYFENYQLFEDFLQTDCVEIDILTIPTRP